MPKPFIVERAGLLSSLLVIVSAIVVAVGLASITVAGFGLGGLGGPLLLVGLVFFVAGLYWLVSYLRAISSLNELLGEESKASFVKNLDEAGYLAWRLPQKYEDALADAKRRFGIK